MSSWAASGCAVATVWLADGGADGGAGRGAGGDGILGGNGGGAGGGSTLGSDGGGAGACSGDDRIALTEALSGVALAVGALAEPSLAALGCAAAIMR